MRTHLPAVVGLAWLLSAATVQAEVFVRWDQEAVPSRASLGISTLVLPASGITAARNALAAGYRVYVEVEASALANLIPAAGIDGVVVKGKATPAQVRLLRQRLRSAGARVLVLAEQGKWPHIRSNWVTKNKEGVLQVTGRSAQPWIENNAALLRIARATMPGATPLLTYSWQPITLSDVDEGPALENYLVAIAETGSFGGDLLLPLHERFQKNLLLGLPQARTDWADIRRYLEFYSWNLPDRYEAIANVGVVTGEPMLWFEVMNLLSRHNVPFELIAPTALPKHALTGLDLLVVLDEPTGTQLERLAEFERKGGQVARVLKGIANPDDFALEIRRKLGREHRIVDIWNGITVLMAPFREPNGSTVLLTALNYAHQPLPVQLRVRGTFALVQYESPEDVLTILPHTHRDGYTEFVLPALTIGARVFATQVSSRLP